LCECAAVQGSNWLPISPLFSALGNFHPLLRNVVYDDTDWYEDGLLDRYQDPGAGAFSYHRGKHWYTMRDVEAGEELFVDYGESWFLDDQLGDSADHIPRFKDYAAAAKICDQWMDKAVEAHFSDWLKQSELDELLQQQELTESPRVRSLIPSTVEDLSSLLQLANKATHSKNTASAIAREMALQTTIQEQTKVSWIEENGLCLENIVPRKSTIRQAGMGAFAQWPIKEGEVIVPVPTLLQVTHSETLNVYESEQVGKQYHAKGEDPVTKQLLLNYCFGNPESTMVICPATNANLINHCGPLVKGEGQCQDGIPNAKVQFATEFDPMTREWMEMSLYQIKEMVENKHRGISLEVVAIRDIEPDEEVCRVSIAFT
jgi:hypothetical protein